MSINKKMNYKKLRFYILIGLVFSVITQILFFNTINTISALLVAFISYVTFSVIFRSNVFPKAMFASFIVISFNISILSGPLVFQTLFLTPIINNLQVPLRVFFFSSLFQISLLIALLLYTNSSFLFFSSKRINSNLKKIGIMKVPSKLQLWIMGIIGLSVTFYYASLNAMGGAEYGDVGNKFLFGLKFLTYAPFLILFRNQMSEKKYQLKKIDFILLSLYFTILLIGAIALNSRGTFAQAILIVVMLTILFILVKQISVEKIKKRLIIIVLLMGFLQPVLSDLAIAMVLARTDRGKISPSELVIKTIEIYQNKQRIEDRIKKDRLSKVTLSSKSNYNEYYIDSTFLSRFLNIKFFDNMFALESTMNGQNSKEILDITNQKILAALPTPILKMFRININKDDLFFSMGDYMLYLNGKTYLGGFKVGSSVAHIFAVFGWFSYIITIVVFLMLFTIIESLTINKNGRVIVSPILMLMILPLYYIASGDSFVNIISFILRTLPQNIFIYLLIFYFVYFITKFLKFPKRLQK